MSINEGEVEVESEYFELFEEVGVGVLFEEVGVGVLFEEVGVEELGAAAKRFKD